MCRSQEEIEKVGEDRISSLGTAACSLATPTVGRLTYVQMRSSILIFDHVD